MAGIIKIFKDFLESEKESLSVTECGIREYLSEYNCNKPVHNELVKQGNESLEILWNERAAFFTIGFDKERVRGLFEEAGIK